MITDDNYLEFLNSIPELTDKQKASEELIFNVTEDILLAMQDTGFTQSQLANALGKSKAHVSSLLNGTRNMTLKTLSDINFVLGTEIKVKITHEGRDVSMPVLGEIDVNRYEISTDIVEKPKHLFFTIMMPSETICAQ
ncbi:MULTISPECIES: helix-turn-helix domain-containing protein [Rosenbergiella]|uniref:helix-turn-helix domain-containing protein n=1 Tax=Rosenbergiella TaxID=1356488 RepID=UPI001F4E976A|nr:MULTISPECIES: helix-turn-helix transcriptional regulator [Rosenbergiella]